MGGGRDRPRGQFSWVRGEGRFASRGLNARLIEDSGRPGSWPGLLPLLVGLVALVVGVAFLLPSGLAVTLGCLGVAKHLGGVGRLALGAGGPLVGGGGAPVHPAPAPDVLVMLVVAGHWMSLLGDEIRQANQRAPLAALMSILAG